ncbi:angiogenic factor with G patch and FHA domains 1 [Rhinophrynus dorsalis]
MARNKTGHELQNGPIESPPEPPSYFRGASSAESPVSSHSERGYPATSSTKPSQCSTELENGIGCRQVSCSSPPLDTGPSLLETGSDEESSPDALYRRVRALEDELRTCRGELIKIQAQLSRSEKLQQYTETQNQELWRQIEELRKELLEETNEERRQTDKGVQTDDCSAWTHSDYYSDSTYEKPYNTYASEVPVQEDEMYGCPPEEVNDDSVLDTGPQEEEGSSLAKSLRATAEAALSQTGFTYDYSTGLYFDHSTGFYYDSEAQLYYDPATGIYYYCDVETGRYQFHSQVDPLSLTDLTQQPFKKKRNKKKKRKAFNSQEGKQLFLKVSEQMKAAHVRIIHSQKEEFSRQKKKAKMNSVAEANEGGSHSSDESEPEEGEITDSDNGKLFRDDDMSGGGCVTSHNFEAEEAIWPPCIRVIVVRSPVLQQGTLFIITAVKRATIGRERALRHTIEIPEPAISKLHAEVFFDNDLQSYVLVDQGSQNGTVINGKLIISPKGKSEPCVLQHGDEVKFGETVLSFHVHPGSDTCNGCEPGQVIAHLRLNKKEEYSGGPMLSKEGKELLRRRGLKKIKVKYGLENADYEENKVFSNPNYIDRACIRRQVVGSEGTFQRDDAPASVHVEIDDRNKGRKMLEKMGWKKGEGLGKTGDGMKDPIQLQLHQKKAGLGALKPSFIEDIQSKSKNSQNWEKARERYAEKFQDSTIKKETNKKETNKPSSWIKGAAE